jgi:polysaccharide chain length determinant protein (PEP-CTERM system associated)
MIGHRPFGWDDYVAIWRRRKILIILPALIGPVLLFGISLVLPNRFESDTLVLIQSQRIPNSMVQSIITEDLNARVASLEEQVLSRTRLEGIIKHYDLFKQSSGQETMEDAVDELRKDIELTPVKPIVKSKDQTLPGFSIGVTLPTAQLAQQVCAEITSMFIEENLRQREQSARGTTNFFQAQIDDAKRQIDEQDAKLAEFKTKYMHELPEETQANLNLLGSMNGQLDVATQTLNRAQQDKTYTESLLSQELASWKTSQAVSDPSQPQTLQEQLAALQSQLGMLEVQDTPEHPDVIKLKDEIEKLKKKIKDEGAAADTKPEVAAQHTAIEPAQIQQLRSQLRADDEAIRGATRTQQRIQQQIDLIQSRVQMSPVVEQQYKELTRDHEMAQNFYNDLLKKKNESEMATDLEQRQQGEQFLIMDPANMPKDPVFPNRPLFALGGLMGGVGLGLALAWLVEAQDKALRNDKDIEACLGLPTLAMVPSLTTAPKEKRFKLGEAGKLGTSEGRVAGA